MTSEDAMQQAEQRHGEMPEESLDVIEYQDCGEQYIEVPEV